MGQQPAKAVQHAWALVKADVDAHGRRVELRSLTVGRGRAKMTTWRIYVDDDQVGYAATADDVETNYRRALAGDRRDVETGRWIPNPPA